MIHLFNSPKLALGIVSLILSVLFPAFSFASSWNPTLLVNSESFNIIDDGDGASDVYVQFGDSLNQSLEYEVGFNRFSFTDDLYVEGNVSASGSLTLNADQDGDAVLTFGNSITDQTISFAENATSFNFSTGASFAGTVSGSSLALSDLKNCDTVTTNQNGLLQCGEETVVSFTGATLASVQARRDTNFTLPALNTWYDIPFNLTDIESSENTLEHDNVNTERILIKETGFYVTTYHINANDGGVTHELQARVLIDNSLVLSGSLTVGRNYQNEYSPNVSTNIAYLESGSYITLQSFRTTANQVINETVLTIIKLDGIKGEKGEKGNPGADGADGADGELTEANADDRYVNTAGDTMTGSLTLSSLTNCDTLDTDGAGTIICGTDGGGGLAIDMPAIQARQSATIAASNGSFADIFFDNTDVESDSSILEHNNTNTDRMDIKADGLYLVTYDIDIPENAANNFPNIDSRVRANDNRVLTGSLASEGLMNFNATINHDSHLSKSFLAILSDGDFITLQIQTDQAGVILGANAIFTVTKLNANQGEKGDKGDAGGITNYFDAYDNVGGQSLAAATVINIDVERYPDANYTLAADVITINSDGDYEITYTGSTDAGNNTRSTNRFWLEIDTGSGFGEVDGTRCWTYTRTGSDGEGSCTRTIIRTISSSDDIRLSGVAVDGNGNVTLADGSSITIKKLN